MDIRGVVPHLGSYGQTYVVLAPAPSRGAAGGGAGGRSRMMAPRDTMFRFGNWCYTGRTYPTPESTAALARGAFGTAVAALQRQVTSGAAARGSDAGDSGEGGLTYAGLAAEVPRRSRFARPAAALVALVPFVLAELDRAEEKLACWVADAEAEAAAGQGGDEEGDAATPAPQHAMSWLESARGRGAPGECTVMFVWCACCAWQRGGAN